MVGGRATLRISLLLCLAAGETPAARFRRSREVGYASRAQVGGLPSLGSRTAGSFEKLQEEDSTAFIRFTMKRITRDGGFKPRTMAKNTKRPKSKTPTPALGKCAYRAVPGMSLFVLIDVQYISRCNIHDFMMKK
ncbi:hypothetical protein NDU88_005028 [Pleurodeles waltl]|uniref:Secreted protein n=1 Tax=Pleurodeles waltl TaxID=8319 RepID=A0AAV7WZZ9_PLEWA|nr:hypothetical protein NDU88_005028 [Pleurodeles waltl]